MTKEHAERYIRVEKRNTQSVDDQVAISHAMWEEDIGPEHGGLKADEIEHVLELDLDYNIGTSVSHLVEIDVLDVVSAPGPDYYAISERLDEIVLGKVEEVATEDVEALIAHMQEDDPSEGDESPAVADGARTTIRSVLSTEFDVVPDALEEYLRKGDQVEKLNTAVQAVKDNEDVEKREDYDEIVFRRGAYRYRLTEEQIARYTREL